MITSLPNSLSNNPVGVTIKKKIVPKIIGDTIFPKKIPNLNHSLFKGVKIVELINPNIKKIKDTIKDHNLKSPSLINGYNAIIKKTIKKTITKLLFELVLIFCSILIIKII